MKEPGKSSKVKGKKDKSAGKGAGKDSLHEQIEKDDADDDKTTGATDAKEVEAQKEEAGQRTGGDEEAMEADQVENACDCSWQKHSVGEFRR